MRPTVEENRAKATRYWFSNDFLAMTPKALAKKEKLDKLEWMKIKNFYIKGHLQQSFSSCHTFLLQQCLEERGTNPPALLATQSQPSVTPHRPPKAPTAAPALGGYCHLSLTTTMTTVPPSCMGWPELPQGLRSHHHPADQIEAYNSWVYLSMSYDFNCNDVTLKNFAKYFLHKSQEERELAEKLMKLQKWGDWVFLRNIKKPDREDWENRLNALHLQSMNQSLLELHKLATDKNNIYLCDFIKTHYLNEQVKYIKELSEGLQNQLVQDGGWKTWHARVSLWQTHPQSQWKWLPIATGMTPLVAKPVQACWSYLYLF